jgi:hypothetical protein
MKLARAIRTRRNAHGKLPLKKLKHDFLVMERRWLSLARSYEFTERLSDSSNETKRQTDKLPKL